MKTITLKSGKEIQLNQAFNMDCLDFMRELPDKCIDLVLTDPPYGIGEDWKKRKWTAKKYTGSYSNEGIPGKEIFDEIFRISKHQIIWGYNYFTDSIGPSNHLIIWDKLVGKDAFYSHGEIAFNSNNVPLEIVQIPWDGGRKGPETGIVKIHPHQKPINLFKWCLEKYAPENAIVFDPFLGSFTTAVACHHYGLQWLGCEKDEDYFKSGYHRYEQETKQLLMEF